MLRAAVVGCGRIGSRMAQDPLLAGDVFTHSEAYVRCDDTELVALCDTDPRRLREAGSRWAVNALFGDAGEMSRTVAPDIVSICTPTDTHASIVETLLESPQRPRVILCEKPLASSVEEGERVVGLAQAKGVVLATIFMRRYAGNFAALRAMLASGELGTVQAVSGWYIGGTLHNGSHWFDMLRYLVGEAQWVESYDALGESGNDPTLDLVIGLEGGRLATLRAADSRRFTVFEMDILTSEGRVQISDSGHRIALFKAVRSGRYTGYVELQQLERDLGDRRDLMLHAVEDAVAALASGRPPLSSGRDGLAALRIAEAALRSRGTRVPVDAG